MNSAAGADLPKKNTSSEFWWKHLGVVHNLPKSVYMPFRAVDTVWSLTINGSYQRSRSLESRDLVFTVGNCTIRLIRRINKWTSGCTRMQQHTEVIQKTKSTQRLRCV